MAEQNPSELLLPSGVQPCGCYQRQQSETRPRPCSRRCSGDLFSTGTVLAQIGYQCCIPGGVKNIGAETKASSVLQFYSLRGEFVCDLGKKDMAARSPAPWASSAGLRSSPQCLIKERRQERHARCAEAGLIAQGMLRPVCHGESKIDIRTMLSQLRHRSRHPRAVRVAKHSAVLESSSPESKAKT